MKKAPGDVIILHMCTKNHDHMMYASWDVECDRENFLSFGPFFTLTPLTIQKIKFLKKKKTPGDIILLQMCTIMKIIWCMVPEIQGLTDNFFCHFGPFVPLLPSWWPGKFKFWKNEKKKAQRYYHFTHLHHKWQSNDV